MREISPDELRHPGEDAGVLWAALKYEPRKRSFRVAKAALTRLGASYDHRLHAWRVPVSEATLEPLERLYKASSLALFVADPDEDVTRGHFERYRP